jgi:ribonuclease HI
MWVTLYTDASYNAEGGGWGIWAKSERGRIIESGRCPDTVTEAILAEMWAIVEGVQAIKQKWGEGLTGIHVKTDCQGAVTALKYRAKPCRRDDMRRIQERVRELLAPDTRIMVRWVKGHQENKSTQAWLNNRVDGLSREHRRGK